MRGMSGWITACSSPCTWTSKPAAVKVSPWPTVCTRPGKAAEIFSATDLQGPDLGGRVGLQGRPQPLLVEVVGVLVRDEDRVRADRGVLLAEAAGVDDERAPVLLQADAGVRLLRELHGSILPRRSEPAGAVLTGLTPWGWSPRG